MLLNRPWRDPKWPKKGPKESYILQKMSTRCHIGWSKKRKSVLYQFPINFFSFYGPLGIITTFNKDYKYTFIYTNIWIFFLYWLNNSLWRDPKWPKKWFEKGKIPFYPTTTTAIRILISAILRTPLLICFLQYT